MAAEFELIDRHFKRATPGAVLGPGDDCALLAPTAGMELAVTTDMLVAGTHFFPDTDPESLGWKTLAVNLSDLAAMGARPRWALLAGALPTADDDWLAAFSRGLFACASAYSCELIGGDTTRGPLCLCVTALGELPSGLALRRDGARIGDDLWISGTPGLAALGLQHLKGGTALPETLVPAALRALHRPTPRVELGIALRGLASAAIDVSDGLLGDLTHVLRRSGVAARVASGALPTVATSLPADVARACQLAGGDDYELLFCAPARARESIATLSESLGLPLARIGEIVAGEPGTIDLRGPNGEPLAFAGRGYEHFG